MGDTPWFIWKLKLDDDRMLMDDRLAKGYNTLFLELLDAPWFEPAGGEFKPVQGAAFTNNGKREFTPPGWNAAGEPDWVLILQTSH